MRRQPVITHYGDFWNYDKRQQEAREAERNARAKADLMKSIDDRAQIAEARTLFMSARILADKYQNTGETDMVYKNAAPDQTPSVAHGWALPVTDRQSALMARHMAESFPHDVATSAQLANARERLAEQALKAADLDSAPAPAMQDATTHYGPSLAAAIATVAGRNHDGVRKMAAPEKIDDQFRLEKERLLGLQSLPADDRDRALEYGLAAGSFSHPLTLEAIRSTPTISQHVRDLATQRQAQVRQDRLNQAGTPKVDHIDFGKPDVAPAGHLEGGDNSWR